MRLAGMQRWSVAGIAAFAVCGTVPIAGLAQAPLPSYSRPATASETVHGRIASIEGAYRITVQDDRGYVDAIALRSGTVINPRGVRLAIGMTVTVTGINSGRTLMADVIDAAVDADSFSAGAYADGAYAGYPDFWVPLYVGGGDVIASPPHGSGGQPSATPPPHVRSIAPPPNAPRHPLDTPNRIDTASGDDRTSHPAPPQPPPARYEAPQRSEPPPQRSEPPPQRSEPPAQRSEPPPQRSEPPPQRSEPPPQRSEPASHESSPSHH